MDNTFQTFLKEQDLRFPTLKLVETYRHLIFDQDQQDQNKDVLVKQFETNVTNIKQQNTKEGKPEKELNSSDFPTDIKVFLMSMIERFS
jgi:hypothetical protein